MVALIFSTAAALILFGSGAASVPYFREGPLVDGTFQFTDFGRGFFAPVLGIGRMGNRRQLQHGSEKPRENDSTGCRDQRPDGNGHIFGDRGACSVD